MNRRLGGIALAWIMACSTWARADDAYFHVEQKDLAKIVDGKIPAAAAQTYTYWRSAEFEEMFRPYAALDGQGEVYVVSPNLNSGAALDGLSARAPAGADVSGRLYWPKTDFSGMVELKFKILAAYSSDKYQKDFLQAKASHYGSLISAGVPGGAWFRHVERQTLAALGEKTPEPGNAAAGVNRPIANRGSLEDTYELFSGGRALSENLQLDRALPAAKRDVPTVDVSTLEGITIAAIDWKKSLKADAHPQLDPLASAIPEDQHAIFFPSFARLLEVVDQADRQGTDILQLANPRSEDQRVQARYERQLCLSTSALSRLLGPALVRSVAVTGSDPYFPTGTDVAILFEAVQPEALQTLLAARVWQGAKSSGVETKAVTGIVGGKGDGMIAYSGYRSDDRAVCSYIALIDKIVVVTNSPVQLARLVDVHQHKQRALAELPEYQFFRTRYPLGAADESALLFLSDPTIRRWCGPKWRIANSRRVRDLAAMDELQADFLDKLVALHLDPGPIHSDLEAPDLGDLRLTSSGVESSTLGTLTFQTPIVELPWDKVTQREADSYKLWRDNYQNNWRWAFDPIALRIHCGEKQLAADLTVMPLIFATEYREEMEISRGVKLPATAGDPHDAPVQWVMAFNREARPMKSAGNLLQGMLPGQADPLSWLGNSIAAWAEEDPFWDELIKKPDDLEREKFFEQNLSRLPVAVQIGVSSRIKLTAFLVGVRGVIEQTAPGMVSWESLTYHDQAYVKLSPTAQAKRELPEGIKDPSLYYAILPDGLLVTLNRRLLEGAIDRHAAREKALAEGKPLPASGQPWLGGSQCLQLNQKALMTLAHFGRETYQAQMQRLAWSNLPILNEWKRRYPDRDPVALQEQYWQTRLVCPGGGKYIWNAEWQTMESTVFGHPGQPKAGPALPPILAELLHANFGLTFEEEGLRARLELERAAAETK